jgi:lipid-binding SYLF domain-containing protein
MKRFCTATLTLAFAATALAWPFGPKGDSKAEKKAAIRQQRDEMLAQLYAANPAMKKVIKQAAGYATFKQVNVNLLLLATANGYGVVVDNPTRKETFMRMGSLGGGVGAGVKDVRVIFVFHDPQVMKQFIQEGWQFGGQADAAAKYQDTGVSAEQNVKANVSFHDGAVAAGSSTDLRAGTAESQTTTAALTTRRGMEIYQFTESGIALQATIAGTKYWQDSKLNP